MPADVVRLSSGPLRPRPGCWTPQLQLVRRWVPFIDAAQGPFDGRLVQRP